MMADVAPHCGQSPEGDLLVDDSRQCRLGSDCSRHNIGRPPSTPVAMATLPASSLLGIRQQSTGPTGAPKLQTGGPQYGSPWPSQAHYPLASAYINAHTNQNVRPPYSSDHTHGWRKMLVLPPGTISGQDYNASRAAQGIVDCLMGVRISNRATTSRRETAT